MAPSSMESSLLGMMREGSARLLLPKPLHVGHAPMGVLKEKERGVAGSMDISCSGQA